MNRSDPPNRTSKSPSSTTRSLGKKMEDTNIPDLLSWQKTLISQIINNLKSNYLFYDEIKEAELQSEMTSKFRKKFSKSEYASEDAIADKEQFAKDVTEIINNIIHDDHIYLSFNKMIINYKEDIESTGKFPWDRGLNEPKIISEEERKQREEDFTHDGCGFHEPRGIDAVEGMIPPHVGYIGLDYVADVQAFSTAKEKAFETMLKVQKNDAIIIDLRNNRGGSPEGMLYLLSFFFQENTHINTYEKFENGAKKEEKEFKTLKKDELNPDPGGKFKDMDPPDLSEKDIYILINEKTISAGEAIAYHMQKLRDRTTIIGMPSVGAAHPSGSRPLLDPDGDKAAFNKNFTLAVPSVNDKNSKTHTNWEDEDKKGVQPDIRIRDTTYELALLTDEIKPEKGKLYVRYENDVIKYKIINPGEKVVKGKIEKAEIETNLKVILPPHVWDKLQPLNQDNLKELSPCLPKILDFISRKDPTFGTDALTLAVEQIQAPRPTSTNRESFTP
jgi:retinol-binding protein 3